MNTPNKITVGRIVATPFIAALIYQPGLIARWSTFVLFVAAAVSDVPLYGIGLLPLWLVILVLGREIVITVFRRFALARGQVIAASGWGKSKAVVQNWFIGSVLVWRINVEYEQQGASGAAWEHWQGYTLAVIEVGMWFVIVLTILSLIDYLVEYRHLWSRRPV